MRRTLVLLSAIVASGCSLANPQERDEPLATAEQELITPVIILPPCNVYVPSQYATVQAAVDAVCDGGTVWVAAGTYEGAAWIVSKRVAIVGAGRGSTTLRATSNYYGVLNFLYNGRGEVRDLAIIAPHAGVLGFPSTRWGVTTDASALPGALSVRNVTISGGEHAVAGQFTSLTLADSYAYGPTSHGVLVDGAKSLSLSNATVSGAGGAGVRASLTASSGCGASINGGHLSYNSGGGLEMIGAPSCPTWVTDTQLSQNRWAGIILRGAGATFLQWVSIANTQSSVDAATYGLFGDGVFLAGHVGELLRHDRVVQPPVGRRALRHEPHADALGLQHALRVQPDQHRVRRLDHRERSRRQHLFAIVERRLHRGDVPRDEQLARAAAAAVACVQPPVAASAMLVSATSAFDQLPPSRQAPRKK